MKRLSMALLATSLLALAACGSRTTANNSATANVSNDVYDVAPDSLTANDLGNGSNASSDGNTSSTANSASSGNSTSGNSASGNSH